MVVDIFEVVVDGCRFFMRWLYVVVDGFKWL